ncbi:hypothetical protein CHARACLAT_027024 [Characodon lateralis]|uniref:Uncharacterized protein n=1 Tax=Characodon lateralis TaxID=208331 RepID=A0ABU7E3W3_9TELE|nr:hypothetical protein [Characodon lateralis]
MPADSSMYLRLIILVLLSAIAAMSVLIILKRILSGIDPLGWRLLWFGPLMGFVLVLNNLYFIIQDL